MINIFPSWIVCSPVFAAQIDMHKNKHSKSDGNHDLAYTIHILFFNLKMQTNWVLIWRVIETSFYMKK